MIKSKRASITEALFVFCKMLPVGKPGKIL
jgi:hypothetical protein